MITLSLAEVAAALGARPLRCPEVGCLSGAVVHDSRQVAEGDLFVAIRGERFDGNDFVAAAVAAGAAAVVTDDIEVADRLLVPTLLVADAVVALGALAALLIRRSPDLCVIAVTGSSGKTSTKDLLAAVLAQFGPTVAAVGSYNNDIGLPMTVLAATRDTRYLVLEMGARAAGDIRRLCRIADPDVGVVLNVGSAHEGQFGSRAATATAKAELIVDLPETGIAILNADDPLVAAMATSTRARVLTFGQSAGADVRIGAVELDPMARPTFAVGYADHQARISLPASGAHHAGNAAAVLAVGVALGLDWTALVAALARAKVRSRWRMEVVATSAGPIVINDAYNANPESMGAALRALKRIGRGRPTWALLGEMRELGQNSDAAHADVGRLAAELGVDHVVAVGGGARAIAAGATEAAGCGPTEAGRRAVAVPDATAALVEVAGQIGPHDVVLVKASRAVGLERLAAELIAMQGGQLESAID